MVHSGRKKQQIALLLALFLALPVSARGAEKAPLPFKVGEKLVFNAYWLFFTAGRFTSNIPETKTVDGRELMHIYLHSQTTNTVEKFWTMDDWFHSWFDPAVMAPRTFQVKIRESTVTKDKTVTFLHESGKALVKKNKDPVKEFEIEPGSLDFFSAGHFARTKPLKIGEEYSYPVFEDNKNYLMRVKPLRKERVYIMDGHVDAIKTQVKVEFEGAFQSRGVLYVWFADNGSKPPIQIKVSSFFGTVTIKLVAFEGVDIDVQKE